MINEATDTSLSSQSGNTSVVSWGAIFAGAAAAAALSLILLILGFGLGLSSVSPWANTGATASTIGISTILWLAFTQIAASGVGGYLAGRLRVKWANIHNDEVFFRDTAHGLLAWAVASLIAATFLGGTIASILGSSVQTGGIMASNVVGAATSMTKDNSDPNKGPMGYFVDTLFRTETPPSNGVDPQTRMEVTRIFAKDLYLGDLPTDDKQYLGQLISQHTGLSPSDATQRVDYEYNRLRTELTQAEIATREAADKARKAAAYAALWMFITMLCGAFFASVMATVGGRMRDRRIDTSDGRRLPAHAVMSHQVGDSR